MYGLTYCVKDTNLVKDVLLKENKKGLNNSIIHRCMHI